MSNFISIESGDDAFYVEVMPVEDQSGIQRRSREGILPEKLTKNDFKNMIRQAVMPACQTFVDVWQELNQPLTAESAEVEFNLGFTAGGSAVIVQASSQASFKVKVNWKFAESRKVAVETSNDLKTASLFPEDTIRNAQAALEATMNEDYGAGGGLLLFSKPLTEFGRQLSNKYVNHPNVLYWTAQGYFPEDLWSNLKPATQKALQTLKDSVKNHGGEGVLFLEKPSIEDLDYLSIVEYAERIAQRRRAIELGGTGGGVVWP